MLRMMVPPTIEPMSDGNSAVRNHAESQYGTAKAIPDAIQSGATSQAGLSDRSSGSPKK